jgi:multidrug efflux pump subunit AcrA (membrane-fusion protein)
MNARVNFLADAASAETGAASNRVLVPKPAVVRKDNSDFVFVIKGNRVEQRVIRRGDEAGDFYHVLEGLSGGESVVTAGAEQLEDGDRVKVGGA